MSGDEIFGYGWREDHARRGDDALATAEALANSIGGVTGFEAIMGYAKSSTAWAAIAQAHYAAANIRTRPIRDVELP